MNQIIKSRVENARELLAGCASALQNALDCQSVDPETVDDVMTDAITAARILRLVMEQLNGE